MPTYEYQCADCGKTFEAVQRITEDALKVCALCGGNNVQRLISATAFVLKGGGWYKTDYASSGSGVSPAPASSSSDTSAAPATESKGDSSKAETAKTEKVEKKEASAKTEAAPAAPKTTKSDS